jgi:hypothetical protein
MKPVVLRAHFDGARILLDEHFDLKPGTPLFVMLLPASEIEYDNWTKLSAQGLAFAYSDAEPEYTMTAVREPNPDYEAR